MTELCALDEWLDDLEARLTVLDSKPGAVQRNFPRNFIARIDSLTTYKNNARSHSDAQVAQIAASIAEFGWTNPVLIDERGELIAGHGRLMAAKKLGLAEVPAIQLEGLSAAQKAALRLADNKLALNAGWDEALLRTELEDLRATGFDLALTGFGEDELAGLFADDGEGAGSSGAGSLAAMFGVPPFSVLNARDGWWQDRKRAWLSLGIQSELGRGDMQPGLSGSPEDYRQRRGTYAKATPGGGADARR